MTTCRVHPFINVTDKEKPVCMVCGEIVLEAIEN